MHVTFDLERRDLRLVEFFRRDHALDRLPFVELRVDHRQSVNVVQRGIGVFDLQRLTDLHRKYVRVVLTAMLIDHHRS